MKFVFLISFLFSYAGIKAQQNHFIYIQTEDRQPFYVKMQEKLYSSSASGYLIVPKLKQGNYSMAIGFPKTTWPEQQLVCTIEHKDAGYLLKNFGEKGWGLFNLQTLNVTMAGVQPTQNVSDIEMTTTDDAFSSMLSSVVNDSTIRQREVVKAKPVVQAEAAPATVTETITIDAAVKEPEENQVVPIVEPAATPVQQVAPTAVPIATKDAKKEMTLEEAKEILRQSELRSQHQPTVSGTVAQPVVSVSSHPPVAGAIIKRSVNTNDQGTEMVFIDNTNGNRDTITVFIAAASAPTMAPIENLPGATTKAKEQPANTSTEARFLDITVPPSGQEPAATQPEGKSEPGIQAEVSNGTSTPAVAKAPEVPAPLVTAAPTPMINSDCKNLANDDDFLKLRKRMAAAEEDDDMIALAKKTFKAKCFRVDQVKNLSVLFLKDAGKYAFFDAAYPFIADSQNFSTLQAQLSDSYYISRFQAMIRR